MSDSVNNGRDCAAAIASFEEQIAAARAQNTTLDIVGCGSKGFYGRNREGAVLSTRQYAGIIDYEPAELVITARSGTLLSELERALAERGQCFAFEPPNFADDATIGGVVAAGLSGPRRPYAGAVRDAMLGLRILSSDGQKRSFGGQVMKNVAGYDVSRLMAGAMGSLGLILDVSIRVAPQEPVEKTLVFNEDLTSAHRRMRHIARHPWPISAMAYVEGRLLVRLSGRRDGVDEARKSLAPHDTVDSDFWPRLRDQRLEFFATDLPLWRLSVPPASAAAEINGASLWEWGGALRWYATEDSAALVRDAAARVGGHATLFRGQSDEPFAPLDPVNFELHRRLKKVFDPHHVFNRGRLYAGM